jgi:hypothetical protein
MFISRLVDLYRTAQVTHALPADRSVTLCRGTEATPQHHAALRYRTGATACQELQTGRAIGMSLGTIRGHKVVSLNGGNLDRALIRQRRLPSTSLPINQSVILPFDAMHSTFTTQRECKTATIIVNGLYA